ncbi:MAG: hypothetical protein ACFFDD_14990 [Promethearchaeota archaeon]
MKNRTETIDYAKIKMKIEKVLNSYGLSLDDFIGKLDFAPRTNYPENDCCLKAAQDVCCPDAEMYFENVDEFDWDS